MNPTHYEPISVTWANECEFHRLFAGNITLKSTSKMKLTFNQILICRSRVMLLSKNMAVTCAAMENKGIHVRCKTANKCLNVREGVDMVTNNNDDPFPSSTFVQIISFCERKPRQKKMETTVKFLHPTILVIIS